MSLFTNGVGKITNKQTFFKIKCFKLVAVNLIHRITISYLYSFLKSKYICFPVMRVTTCYWLTIPAITEWFSISFEITITILVFTAVIILFTVSFLSLCQLTGKNILWHLHPRCEWKPLTSFLSNGLMVIHFYQTSNFFCSHIM